MRSDLAARSINLLGGWGLRKLLFLFATAELLYRALMQGLFSRRIANNAVQAVLLRQIYFTGFEAWKIIVVTALILGTVIISQVMGLVGGGNGSLPGKVLVWVVFRELAPLITAVIIIARSGTAIAAELGSMKINGEIEALELMGIDREQYLILPRIMGVAASVIILTIYFVFTSFVGSFLVASIGFWHIPYDQFVQGIVSSLGMREVVVLTIKTTSFGIVIPAICCQFGLNVGESATEVPQAATRAVITSLFSIFMLDGIITFLSSLV
jgi:phospholipid/cholesterol/gamma-HCH transport system permease protein